MMDSDDDFISCHICLYDYDYQEHQPKYLDCHHYFCSSCLKALCNTAVMNVFPCPTCRDPTKVCGRKVRDFKTNHVVLRLIQLMQDRTRERKFFTQILESIKTESDSEDEMSQEGKVKKERSCFKAKHLHKPIEKDRLAIRRPNETTQQFRIRLAKRRTSSRKRDQREQLRRRW